jgi:hypothetical protein
MVTLRAFLALLAGFLTVILCTAALTALLRRLIPSWVGEQIRLTLAYVIVNLGYSFLAASAGGYVTAWIAHANPLYHVLMLGIIVLVLAALSALQSRAGRPVWYQLALVTVAPIGVLSGGLLQLRMVGVL